MVEKKDRPKEPNARPAKRLHDMQMQQPNELSGEQNPAERDRAAEQAKLRPT